MALVSTLSHHRAASVRAEAAKMFLENADAHGICLQVQHSVPEFASLAGGDWINRIPRALTALGVGLYNPTECPRAADIQLQSPPGDVVTLHTVSVMGWPGQLGRGCRRRRSFPCSASNDYALRRSSTGA